MARSKNAQIAADLYDNLRTEHNLSASTAWHGIARLLLTCQVQRNASAGWTDFRNVIVYREINDFPERGDSNKVSERAEALSQYVANSLGVDRTTLCQTIGEYWRNPRIVNLQQHNLVGHAFRSLLVQILQTFGNPSIAYEEEVDPYYEFPGYEFQTRSKRPKIDIVARKGGRTVALISSKWRYRHDRTEFIDEALACAGPARRLNSSCKLYVWVGEFSPNRLEKSLDHCPPRHSNPALSGTIHFHAPLVTVAIGHNGRMTDLRDLTWLIQETFDWK